MGHHLLLLLSLAATLQAQFTFRPPTENFSKETYKAASQNWAVAQSSCGEILVGNNEGLLRYDGYHWELSGLPAGSPVYSILVDGERVYTGGIREFGYWTRSSGGALQYHSLSAGLPKDQLQTDEIWTILKQGNRILFHAFHAIHVFDSEKLTTFRTPSFIMSPQVLDSGQLLVWLRGEGLHVLDAGDSGFSPYLKAPFRSPLADMVTAPDGTKYLFTYREGVFIQEGDRLAPFPTEADALFRETVVRQVLLNPLTGDFIVGTHLGGVFVLSPEGRLKLRFSARDEDLLSDQVFSVEMDSCGNVWLALGKGLAKLSLSALVWHSEAFQAQYGTLNTAAYKAPYLYLGTSRGLFRGVFSEDFTALGALEQVPSVPANVMDLYSDGEQLFCGTGGYTYEIFPDSARPVCPVSGGAQMAKGFIGGREVLLQRTYSGLCVYLKEDGKWVYKHPLASFSVPVRSMVIDADGAVWVREMYGGLHRLELDAGLSRVVSDKVFDALGPTPIPPVTLGRFHSRAVFSSGRSGFYTYDNLDNCIVPYDRLLACKDALLIDPLGKDDYAFHYEGGILFVREEGDSLQVIQRISRQLLGGMNPDGYRPVVPLQENRYLFLQENSLALCSLPPGGVVERKTEPIRLSRFVGQDLENHRDSLFSPERPIRVPWKNRHLSIGFAYPRFGLLYHPTFRYRIDEGRREGFFEPLGETPQISLTHLREGRYTLTIEALSLEGKVLSSCSCAFEIRPPWRRSAPMIVLYWLLALLFVTVLFLFIYYRKQSHHLSLIRQMETSLHQEQVKALNTELAQRAMTAFHWNETLLRIKQTLQEQKDRLGKDYPDKDYRAISEFIDSQMYSDFDWPVFENKFNLAYDNFLSRLKERCPVLTETDLRYCAYLKMGMANREVASIMNITQRGAESARYRIKSKLGLPPEQSLADFLKEI